MNRWNDVPEELAAESGRRGWGFWILAGLVGAVLVAGGVFVSLRSPDRQRPSLEELVRQRQELDKTIWADEVTAQQYEEPFVALWDAIRNAADKFEPLKKFSFRELMVGSWSDSQPLELGIRVARMEEPSQRYTPPQWNVLLEELARKGYRLVECEFHHSKFFPPKNGPARSVFSSVFHVENRKTNTRYILKGNIHVQWAASSSPQVERLELRDFQVLYRTGKPVFQERFTIGKEVFRQNPRVRTMPLFYDLDGDGLTELILPNYNLVYWNEGGFRFRQDVLLEQPPQPIYHKVTRRWEIPAAALADFSGDGHPDLLLATGKGLFYCEADRSGHFTKLPRHISVPGGVLGAYVIAVGDIDGDKDLDFWVGQYLRPYINGQMPTPYYDANNGLPSYLFRNDGNGKFVDITEEAGLGAKRFRRTYSASLVDLDDDGDLDLLTVSDFAGLDLYENDGKGHFTDVTDRWVDKRHAFGMSHTFGDYNLDGRLDFYMIGMSSTTARRLDQLGLGRDDAPDKNQMRKEMGYGNRMYLNQGGGIYRQAPFNDQVARTGWSWGSTSLDFDNDGDLDIYVCNGHISRGTAKDYCTRYWCHDVYIDVPEPDPEVNKFFVELVGRQEQEKMSWNGYEHNVLWLNVGGAKQFVNIGFLMGVALERDSRFVARCDLDNDGRVDLALFSRSLEPDDYGSMMHFFRNEGNYPENNWIGLRLYEQGGGRTPWGTFVEIQASDRKYVWKVTNGDSFQVQQPPLIHFGLGRQSRITSVRVRWPDGSVETISHPQVNRYYLLQDRKIKLWQASPGSDNAGL